MPKKNTQYEFIDCNRYGVLKVSGSLWLVILLESWRWIFLSILVVSSLKVKESASLLPGHDWIPLALQSPTLLLAITLAQRVPSAGDQVRFLWKNGRVLISLAAAPQIIWILFVLYQADEWRPIPERALLLEMLLHALALTYLWTNRYCQTIFAEFPERENAEKQIADFRKTEK